MWAQRHGLGPNVSPQHISSVIARLAEYVKAHFREGNKPYDDFKFERTKQKSLGDFTYIDYVMLVGEVKRKVAHIKMVEITIIYMSHSNMYASFYFPMHCLIAPNIVGTSVECFVTDIYMDHM